MLYTEGENKLNGLKTTIFKASKLFGKEEQLLYLKSNHIKLKAGQKLAYFIFFAIIIINYLNIF